MKSGVSEANPSQQPTAVPAMLSSHDYVAWAKELEALKLEYAVHEKRMIEIRAEIMEKFSLLNVSLSTEVSTTKKNGLRLRPRPVEDKISISAGKAISKAISKRKSPDQCYTEAVAAALVVAGKYNMTVLPDDVVQSIQEKIRFRFNLPDTPAAAEVDDLQIPVEEGVMMAIPVDSVLQQANA